MTWMELRHGGRFEPLAPDPTVVNIDDIMYALSHLCRFGGHTPWHYSVLHHSLLVAAIVPTAYQRAALLHDATEAYLIDVPRPIKESALMAEYRALEARWAEAIEGALCIPPGETSSPVIKAADAVALATEARAFFGARADEWQVAGMEEPWQPQHCTPRVVRKCFDYALGKVTRGEPITWRHLAWWSLVERTGQRLDGADSYATDGVPLDWEPTQ